MSALDYLVQQGKVRYLGLSNYPGWKVMKLSNIASEKNYSKFISGQYLYNLLKRDIEKEILPACSDIGMGIMCWSPLSGGMLTGKYENPSKPPKDSRIGLRNDVVQDRYEIWYEKSKSVIDVLKSIAGENNTSPSVVALAWLLKNKNIASVLVGSNKVEQIKESCKASEWVISDGDWKSLDEISRIDLGYPNDVEMKTTKNWFQNIL